MVIFNYYRYISKILIHNFSKVPCKNLSFLADFRYYSSLPCYETVKSINFKTGCSFPTILYLNQPSRLKYTREKKSKTKAEDSDNESDEEDLDDLLEKNAKIVTSYLSIPRVDAVIKAGLGIARNKAEILFFENKIRINGYKVPKKSHRVHLNDEVDVIKSLIHEGKRLMVSRVIVKSAKEVEERDELKCKLKVFKNLEIDNYSEHPYKSNQSDNIL